MSSQTFESYTLITENESVAPVAPRGGNTDPPRRGAGAKHWIGTLPMDGDWFGSNGSNGSSFFTKLESKKIKYIAQVESGETTGYQHLQIYIQLPNKQRLSYLKTIHSTGHWEIARSPTDAQRYCAKSETRLMGPYHNMVIPRDIQALLSQQLDHPLRPWQEQLKNELLNNQPHARTVIVYVDEVGNTGKTWFVKHFCWKYPESGCVYITTTRSADILTAIDDNTQIVLIDIPRCVSNNDIFPANAIEQIKNGMITQGKLQKQMQFILIPSVHVVVFTNHYPDLTKLSHDRWDIRNISLNHQTENQDPRQPTTSGFGAAANSSADRAGNGASSYVRGVLRQIR